MLALSSEGSSSPIAKQLNLLLLIHWTASGRPASGATRSSTAEIVTRVFSMRQTLHFLTLFVTARGEYHLSLPIATAHWLCAAHAHGGIYL